MDLANDEINSADIGGAIHSEGTTTDLVSPIIRSCSFIGNTATLGGGALGGLYCSPTVTNCIFQGNTAMTGGGIYTDNSSPTIINNTFSGNSADDGGAIHLTNSSLDVTNSILWGDTATSGDPEIAVGINSTATVLGHRWARFEYSILIIDAYVVTVGMIVFGVLPLWSLLTLLTIPPAIKNIKAALKSNVQNPDRIASLDVQTAQLHLLFGILLMISILLRKVSRTSGLTMRST